MGWVWSGGSNLAPGPLGLVAGDPDRHRGWLLCPSSAPAAAGCRLPGPGAGANIQGGESAGHWGLGDAAAALPLLSPLASRARGGTGNCRIIRGDV
jgi:hypothetical protein